MAELHAVSNRLWHDYRLMRCAARASVSDPFAQTALEDSFALHLCRLQAFLFPEDGADDAPSANDFLGSRWNALRPPPSALLAAAVRWAERRLAVPAPICFRANEEPREWTLVEASLALQRIMDPFVSNTPRALLGKLWKVSYHNGLTV